MSRAYKALLADESSDLGATGLTAANAEKLSGADLEQLRLSVLNGTSAASVDANGVKALGNNVKFTTLAVITADGVNTVTVDDTGSLYVGQIITIRNGGTTRAADRTITAINYVTNVVTYNGADASATIVANDVVGKTTFVNNAELSGADLTRFAGDQ